MRKMFSTVDIDGTVVIGEGEMDEAPMLYIGEKVGLGEGHPKVDIAVDPVDGTVSVAKGFNNAIAIIAMAPEGKLLPMYSNSSLNRYLKRIAEICGIGRKLVFHAARHTYATEITLSHGVPLETVSKMLGHSRIETTQHYAKVTDNKIDTDTKALDKKIAERFSVVI